MGPTELEIVSNIYKDVLSGRKIRGTVSLSMVLNGRQAQCNFQRIPCTSEILQIANDPFNEPVCTCRQATLKDTSLDIEVDFT